MSVANQFANEKVIFVAGHYCSGASIPASSVYAENGILQISPASTNPALTDDAAKKGWNNVFRVCGRDDSQGRIAGTYIVNRFKGKNVAVIDDKSAYGKGLADQTRLTMNKLGMKEAMTDSVNQGDKDFSALISKMKEAKIAAIYYGGYYAEAGLIVRQAHDQGLNAVLMGGDALVTTDLWKITGLTGNGTLMTFPPDPRDLQAAQPVVAEFKKAGYDPEGYTLYTYAAVQIWAAAANEAKTIDGKKVAQRIRSGKWDTVLGPISYDAKGDITTVDYVFYRWNSNGGYDEIPDASRS